ncbi:unnamed protein product [Eruca vesicaria subsp. sativa]|uniref:Secreted protein n=1 Tax=Eruca vesicaria subsp. sativa TaxID=29727 RepID=A0ABC8JWM8_ERUVS|nr:unnamed protein product [Eruca vesicaria subsp. sativa]
MGGSLLPISVFGLMHILLVSNGCVACYREPRSTETPLNDPLSSSIAQLVKKPSVSEDFWPTSTVDMDNITFPSQGGSIS